VILELEYTDARAIEKALDGPETTALPRDALRALKALYEDVCAERDLLQDELAEERAAPDLYEEGYEAGYKACAEAAK